MTGHTIAALAQALRERRVSSVELAHESLSRIEQAQSVLNAFITIDRDGALAAARAADAVLARGDGGALTWDPLESTCRHASLSIL